MSDVDNSEWYALVKYKSGNKTEVVPVHKIRMKVGKGERVTFNPKFLTDFDKTKFYTVNTTHGSEDGKEHKWYALIGLLAESRDALQHAMVAKRVSWPIVSGDESEPISTDNDAALERVGLSNMTIISNRYSNRNKKKTKKDATDAVHAKLLTSRSLNPSNTCNASVSITDDEDIVTRLLRENEELKSALKAEKKRNNPPEKTDYINIFQECMQKIEEKVEKMQENFEKKLTEDVISKFPQSYLQNVQQWLNSLPKNGNIED